jgi:hypothetical protein
MRAQIAIARSAMLPFALPQKSWSLQPEVNNTRAVLLTALFLYYTCNGCATLPLHQQPFQGEAAMPTKRTHPLTRLNWVVPIAVTLAMAGSAAAGGSFDGIYRGSQTLQLNSNTQLCTNRDDIVLHVQNNHFNWRWVNSVIGVDVASDGTFDASGTYEMGRNLKAPVTIKGKIVGASLEADMASNRCALHLSLKKS